MQTAAAVRSAPEVIEPFRLAMRSMAATVTILSTAACGRRYGMTATAVTSVSMAPPSLLVSVNREASIHSPLSREKRLCVNVLAESQQRLCADFSGGKTGEERFQDGEWALRDGLPYLLDAQANIFCLVDHPLDYGTHTLFLCRVADVRLPGAKSPLVYLAGGFLPAGCRGTDAGIRRG